MSIHLTPEAIVGCYEFLRQTPPFSRWGLPDSDDVTFRVINKPRWYGFHRVTDGHHEIEISARTVGHTATLVMTMAHEMIHMRQGMRGDRDTHGASFQRMARSVCRYHGFDLKAF